MFERMVHFQRHARIVLAVFARSLMIGRMRGGPGVEGLSG
jgi:hypothetical protein